MRFAVVEGEVWPNRAAMPPSAQGNRRREGIWRQAMDSAQGYYDAMIDDGMPAEDARGVVPHDMTTRLHWVLDLRGLLHVAGLRTCTQAQFEWRLVMAQVAKALREWGAPTYADAVRKHTKGIVDGATGEQYQAMLDAIGRPPDAWQFELIADKLRPVCYQTGRCGFMAKFDRACKIRDRVERFAANGVPSSNWDTTGQYDVAEGPSYGSNGGGPAWSPLLPIHPYEWAADPAAAR
jgi:thymidylate synthase ThyX